MCTPRSCREWNKMWTNHLLGDIMIGCNVFFLQLVYVVMNVIAVYHGLHDIRCLLGQAKRSPSHLGGAKTGSLVRRGCTIVLVHCGCAIVFGTLRLRNS